MLYFTAVVEVNLDPIPKMIFDFFFDGLVSICYGPALGSSNFELQLTLLHICLSVSGWLFWSYVHIICVLIIWYLV